MLTCRVCALWRHIFVHGNRSQEDDLIWKMNADLWKSLYCRQSGTFGYLAVDVHTFFSPSFFSQGKI